MSPLWLTVSVGQLQSCLLMSTTEWNSPQDTAFHIQIPAIPKWRKHSLACKQLFVATNKFLQSNKNIYLNGFCFPSHIARSIWLYMHTCENKMFPFKGSFIGSLWYLIKSLLSVNFILSSILLTSVTFVVYFEPAVISHWYLVFFMSDHTDKPSAAPETKKPSP